MKNIMGNRKKLISALFCSQVLLSGGIASAEETAEAKNGEGGKQSTISEVRLGDASGQSVEGEQSATLDDYILEGITVVAARPEWEEILSPGSVTVIEPQKVEGEQKTLAELLRDVPGIHVREVNGKGQYTTVSVRGSTAAQVGVFVDGILTNLGGDAAADISAIPIDNVERIEVYRGYIPARFAGTFIGGVINIVTKRPDKAHISVEIGKSSFGGDKASLEYVMPLGSGSLMIGMTHENSNGRFKYRNFAAGKAAQNVKQNIDTTNEAINKFTPDNIDNYGNLAGLTFGQIATFQADQGQWLDYVRNPGAGGFAADLSTNAETTIKNTAFNDLKNIADRLATYKQAYFAAGYNEQNWLNGARDDWDGRLTAPGIIGAAEKQDVINQYVDEEKVQIPGYVQDADPDKSPRFKNLLTELKKFKDRQEKLASEDRYRKYNDYKKNNLLIKWQDKNWTVKGTYYTLDRHLPDSLWGGDVNNIEALALVDIDNLYYYDSRRQKINNKEILIQHRKEIGNLEWGVTVNFLRSDKKYRSEVINLSSTADLFVPLREWSRYKSDRYNIQLDGSYKLSKNQMLDFQTNYSREKLKITGSLMDEVLSDTIIGNSLASMRDKYEQEIFNLQLQDTITLDNNSTWFLSPSIKYNSSTIKGTSSGDRFSAATEKRFSWLHQTDSQRNGKATWQIAVKKIFDENWTVRATAGTYYRLLNMYEIAGDGAGILPRPYADGGSIFPVPEQGKQFDLSVMWKGETLGAKSSATLTYFWRDTKDMLQLERYGKDYSCYFNDRKGKAHGIEAQWQSNWEKFAFDLRATYTNLKVQSKETATGTGYRDLWPTYQPKWEGTMRLSYTPVKEWTVFGELQYVGEYFTSSSKGSATQDAYLSGRPVSALTRINLGVKWKPKKEWQITFGCNDIFNRAPNQKINSPLGSYNIEYPLQGRTYYATVNYNF